MISKKGRSAAAAAVLPWGLALAGLAFGSAMWFRAPSASNPAASSTSESNEIKALKTALASANATSDALRHELDRLRVPRDPATAAAGPGDVHAAAQETAKGPTSEQQEMGKRLKDALT